MITRRILAVLLTLSLLPLAGSALADDHGRHGRDEHSRDRHYGNAGRFERHERRHDNVSVNLSFSSGWHSSAFGYGHRNRGNTLVITPGLGYVYSGPAYRPSRPRYTPYTAYAPVIIQNRSYVREYDEPRVVIRRGNGHVNYDLLKDINGRCFEREFDAYGNETSRVEVTPNHCDF